MGMLPKAFRNYGGEEITLPEVGRLETKYKNLYYPVPKYLQFIRKMLVLGYKVVLYDAQSTASKYVYVKKNNKSYKVRFSNHKPNKEREKTGECDFFVGVTHYGVTTTDDAIRATLEYFK